MGGNVRARGRPGERPSDAALRRSPWEGVESPTRRDEFLKRRMVRQPFSNQVVVRERIVERAKVEQRDRARLVARHKHARHAATAELALERLAVAEGGLQLRAEVSHADSSRVGRCSDAARTPPPRA